MINKRFAQGLLILVVFCVLVTLCGCSKEPETVKNGIEVLSSENPEPTEETKDRAGELIEAFVRRYFNENGERVSEEEILNVRDEILNITLSEGLSDFEYGKFLDVLEDKENEIFALVFSKTEDSVDIFGSIFYKLTEDVRPEFFGSLIYGITLIGYDRKIDANLALNKPSGNVLANNLMAEREILESGIGKESFSALLNLSFFARGLFVEGALNSEVAEQFSDSELLLFIKRMDLSGIEITSEGFKLLVDKYCKSPLNRDESFTEKVFLRMNLNNDIDNVSEVFADVLKLASSVIDKMSAEDIGYLRSENTEKLLNSLFSRFSDTDWQSFERITSVGINSKSYVELARSFYGEVFDDYLDSQSEYGIEQLKMSVGEEDFYKKMEGYIFGISPAFSFGMRK